MAMTVEEVARTLNLMIEHGEIDPDSELRILMPQYRNDLSYPVEIIHDETPVLYLEADVSAPEYFTEYTH